jgi:hypothetical protein
MADNLDQFTVKEILTQFVLPEIREKADANKVDERLTGLERDVRELQARVLTPESVASMIGASLEKKEARGWTTKERVMAVILLMFAAVGAVVSIVQLLVNP